MQIGQGTDPSLCWSFYGLWDNIIVAIIAGDLREVAIMTTSNKWMTGVPPPSPFPTATQLHWNTHSCLHSHTLTHIHSDIFIDVASSIPAKHSALPTPNLSHKAMHTQRPKHSHTSHSHTCLSCRGHLSRNGLSPSCSLTLQRSFWMGPW